MTTPEACTLAVDLTRQLSAARAERDSARADRDSWQLVALAMSDRVAELTRELAMVDERQYICRTRVQDQRDVWLDQRDLRQEAA